mgnify:CR=1 FL=1
MNAGDDYDGKYVAPGADVDLEGAEWTPIGAGTRKSSGIARAAHLSLAPSTARATP